MRPRKLDAYEEELLVTLFEKARSEMKGRSNQFQVASKLKVYFPYDAFHNSDVTSLAEEKRRSDLVKFSAEHFGLPSNTFTRGGFRSLGWYIAVATPAAIVQMVKRIKLGTKHP